MRRSIALLAGVAAVFVVAARPVAAAPGAPAPGNGTAAPTVPPDAVGLSLSQVAGSGLAVTLDPGASEEHDLVVSNHTANLRLTIKLGATDATGVLGSAAASWLAFGDDEIQLDPHAATTVPMTVAVPHDTQPGPALAHVSASVETAVSAADGSPVAGTASETFPVSISVSGTPTAQIAIADVHRDDQGSRHQLAVVLRNFGDQGAQVAGHVRIAGDTPQTLPFHADLAASRDTTVELKWNAPPVGTPSDIAVDLEYGRGNVASWSSRLGGAPTDLSPRPAATTPTTSAVTPAASSTTTGSASKPWWKQTFVTVLAVLLLLAAVLWFGFEMLASRRRRDEVLADPRRRQPAPGWAPAPSDESIDLAKQLVRLTDIVVQLVAAHRDEREFADGRARARSPGSEPVAAAPPARSRADVDELGYARAGPAPPDAGPPDAGPPGDPPPPIAEEDETEVAYPAPLPPGAVARPEPVAPLVAPVVAVDEAPAAAAAPIEAGAVEALVVDDDEDYDEDYGHEAGAEVAPEDPRAPLMARLMELDRQRRRLRDWMDAEESGEAIEPSPEWYAYSGEPDADGYRADAPGESS